LKGRLALREVAAQTVNYTESHDDRGWLDVITGKPRQNGLHPTATIDGALT